MLKGQPWLIPLWIEMGPAKRHWFVQRSSLVLQGEYSVNGPLIYSVPPLNVIQELVWNTVKGIIEIQWQDAQRDFSYLGVGENIADVGSWIQQGVARKSTKSSVLELIGENVSKATDQNSIQQFIFTVKDGGGSITIRRVVSIILGKTLRFHVSVGGRCVYFETCNLIAEEGPHVLSPNLRCRIRDKCRQFRATGDGHVSARLWGSPQTLWALLATQHNSSDTRCVWGPRGWPWIHYPLQWCCISVPEASQRCW